MWESDLTPFLDIAAQLGWEVELTASIDSIDATAFGEMVSTYLPLPRMYRLVIHQGVSGYEWVFKGTGIDVLKAQAMVEMLK